MRDVQKQQTLSGYVGVVPPAMKRQTESGHKKRLLSEKWLQDMPWLEANNEHTEMLCKTCSHPHPADKTGVFYIGSKNLNHLLFDKHKKSREHMNVPQAIANKQAS